MECIRCGLCCHITRLKNGVECLTDKCKYLIRLPSGKTICRIYHNRLGSKIEKGFFCILRKDTKYDYENCPLNTGKKIITKTGVKNDMS